MGRVTKVHHFKYIGSSVEETGRHDNIHYTVRESNMGKMGEMQWRVVCQEDASEIEGACLHNCGQTSYIV